MKIVERSGSSSPLFDVQEDYDQSFSENGRPSSPVILPKVLVRLTVVKNGVYLPHPKSITMDPNLDFNSFTTLLHQYVCHKLDFDDEDISVSDVFYYITWQSKKEANAKKSRSSITNYAVLQTEEDWKAIVHNIQSTYSNPKKPLNDMLLCVVGKVKINNSAHEVVTDSDNEGPKQKVLSDVQNKLIFRQQRSLSRRSYWHLWTAIPIRKHLLLFKLTGLFVLNIMDIAILAEADLMMDCIMIFNLQNGDVGLLIFLIKQELYIIHLVLKNLIKV